MLRTKLLAVLPVLFAAAATPACAMHSGQLASDTSGAEDVTGTESDVESLATSFIGSDGQSVATQSLAGGSSVQLADITTVGNPGYYFMPAGCIQETENTAQQSVSYVFNGCTGPLGLVALNGTVNATWQVAQNQLTIDFSSQNFQINHATIDSWQATAVVTASGNQRTMTWNATLSGTTARGRQFNRTNQKNITWTVDVACISATGQSSGDVLGVSLQTSVISWQRCADACPQAGSQIAVKDLSNGDSIAIDYNGGDTAEMTIDGGKSIEIGLACGL